MNSPRTHPRRLGHVARAMLLLAASAALGACASRTTTGTVLHAGESATVRLAGSPIRFEIANIGLQSLDYTLTEHGVETSHGSISPGSRVAESRDADGVLITITNPGPGLAHAAVETSSRHGMEFRQPPARVSPGS
ncbi:MAG: hypothetical protein H6809_05380 [Phycisphaeraceae bacterium]|nr:hypothetical protein [Phycisphaeraceae bacterium]